MLMQVADAHFASWAAGRLTGVTGLHVLPCQSAVDRIAQSNLTAGESCDPTCCTHRRGAGWHCLHGCQLHLACSRFHNDSVHEIASIKCLLTCCDATGLCALLSMCGGGALKSLTVSDTISLSQLALRHLPGSLEEVSLSVAFDDSCMENKPHGTYAFPASMPHLRRLRLQV